MRLYLLRLATLQPGSVPVLGYVVQTDGVNVLIDGGFPSDFIANPPTLTGGLRIEMSEEDYIVKRLDSIGLRPDDIQLLVCTHLDADHAGGHRVFTNAELFVQREHYEFARQSDHPRFAAIREHWDHPSLRYRLTDGDTELVPGVELVETSGHVPGHQAILVRLPETGPVLLAADAIPHPSMPDPETLDTPLRHGRGGHAGEHAQAGGACAARRRHAHHPRPRRGAVRDAQAGARVLQLSDAAGAFCNLDPQSFRAAAA